MNKDEKKNQPTVASEVKKAVMEKVVSAPNGEESVKPEKSEKKPQVFAFTEEGFQAVNNFLALAGESEKQGILDYKSAFHSLVAKVREGIKPM